MPLIAASLLMSSLCLLATTQDLQTAIDQSKILVTEWVPLIVASKGKGDVQRVREKSWTLDQEFEKVNGGCDGSLAMQATLLHEKDVAIRRAAATTIGSIRSGVGNQPADWPTFRSKELQLAAKYVLDQDPETSANATTAFVNLLGGEAWDGWAEFQPKWLQALSTAKGERSRSLMQLFAFTSIPIADAVPGIFAVFQRSDPQTSAWAACALSRAEILAPMETTDTILAGSASTSPTERRTAFKSLETLTEIIWVSGSAPQAVNDKLNLSQDLQTAWSRCTMIRGDRGVSRDWQQSLRRGHLRLLALLEKGLADPDHTIRISSAKALIPIGKAVDADLSSGSSIRMLTDKDDVARSLLQASRTVRAENPTLANQAQALAVGFDRMRVIG